MPREWGSVGGGQNGVGGVLIPGCELGDSLRISGRMAQGLGRSLSEMRILFGENYRNLRGSGGIAQLGSV